MVAIHSNFVAPSVRARYDGLRDEDASRRAESVERLRRTVSSSQSVWRTMAAEVQEMSEMTSLAAAVLGALSYAGPGIFAVMRTRRSSAKKERQAQPERPPQDTTSTSCVQRPFSSHLSDDPLYYNHLADAIEVLMTDLVRSASAESRQAGALAMTTSSEVRARLQGLALSTVLPAARTLMAIRPISASAMTAVSRGLMTHNNSCAPTYNAISCLSLYRSPTGVAQT
jgi:hypothetical protein